MDNEHEHESTDEIVGTAAAAKPWRPTEAWIAALKAEITPMTMAYAQSYARARLRAGAASYCDETPRALAWAALTDTAIGLGRWEPTRGPLHKFLCARIKHTLGVQQEQARRMVRLDYVTDGDPEVAVLDRALSHDPRKPTRVAERAAAEVGLAMLRARLADDPTSQAWLDARLAGHTTLAEVVAATGRTPTEVRAAYMRIVRAARALPPTLHDQYRKLLA